MDDFEECRANVYKGEEQVNYYYDELIELYDIATKIDEDIKNLWKNTINRYLKYCDERQILTKIPDYPKFYEYMVKNHRMYRYVLNRIYELENEDD
ncbi:hypothetical protein Indivirus_1_71 [Indivirus ILV1]|uniref:Uncharacterized protein n=1 Tax=Indivirus ILV1 TaxID=1977633 RepID=A0A1V0SCR4_9VIRU|nr:hypothetical protein Indivirus_1_71 [Indivirus ILV1]